MRRLVMCALTVFFLPGSPAVFACAISIPIEGRIARSQADTILLAVVERAAYGGALYGEGPWEGTAARKRILKGNTDSRVFPIGRTGSSAACDDGTPAPQAGDIWVLYLKDGKQVHSYGYGLAYPLDIARKSDPELDALLHAGGNK